MLYEVGASGLQPIETDSKNDLPRGTVLLLNGYGDPRYVIVENLGVNDRFSHYGAKYLVVNLKDNTQSQKNAHELKWIEEKKDNRIQTYITHEIKTEEEVLKIWETSEVVRRHKEQIQTRENEVKETQINKGRELFKQHIPEDAKALIVAECHKDESDLQTDYFSHRTTETVILGHSKHTRDLFSEMRKYAAKIPEAAHLATAPEVDSNGEKKTDFNKDWWTPADEHRDKHSMGAGYYLKVGWINSTGWCIRKRPIYEDRKNEFYLSLGKRCIF